MKFGERLTGYRTLNEAYSSGLKAHFKMISSGFNSFIREQMHKLSTGLSLIFKPSEAVRLTAQKYFLSDYFKDVFGGGISPKGLSQEYYEAYRGEVYRSMGEMENKIGQLYDIARKVRRMIGEGRVSTEDIYRYFIGESDLFDRLPLTDERKIIQDLKKTAIELGESAFGLDLLRGSSLSMLRDRYFPHITLEFLDNMPESPYVLYFAVRNSKLFYDRWLSRLREYDINEEQVKKYPDILFTFAMLQEVFDIYTAKLSFQLINNEKQFGYPNISKDAIIQLPNGQEVPISIALDVRETISSLIRKVDKKKIVQKLKSEPDYLYDENGEPRSRESKKKWLEEKMSEFNAWLNELKGKREAIDKQVRRYKYILVLLNELKRGRIDEDKFRELAISPDPTYIGLKKEKTVGGNKVPVDVSYLQFDADYYLSRLNDWMMIESPKLGFEGLQAKLKAVPNVKDYHAWAGMLVTKAMFTQIAEYYEMASPRVGYEFLQKFNNFLVDLTNLHKFFKVAMNPPSYLKNIVGDFFFMYLFGLKPSEIPKYLYEGLLLLTNEKSAQILKNYGIKVGSFSAEIVHSFMRALKKDMQMMENEKAFFLPQRFIYVLYEKTKELGFFDIYDLIDQVTRAGMIKYMNDNLEFGKPIFEIDENYTILRYDDALLKRAMTKSFQFTIDYSDVSPLLRQIRSGGGVLGGAVQTIGVTPFITFLVHAPFVFAQAFKRNPVRASIVALLPLMMFSASWLLTVKDEEGKLLWRVATENYKNFKTIVLPFKDEKTGKWTFISFAGFHPLDNYYDFVSNLFQGQIRRALMEMGIIYSNPINQVIMTILTGYEPFTDKIYFTDLDKAMPDRYILKLIQLITDVWSPTFLTSYGLVSYATTGADRAKIVAKMLGLNLHYRSIDEFINYRKAEILRELIDIGKRRGELKRKLYRKEIDERTFDEVMRLYDELEQKVRESEIELYKKHIWRDDEDEEFYNRIIENLP